MHPDGYVKQPSAKSHAVPNSHLGCGRGDRGEGEGKKVKVKQQQVAEASDEHKCRKHVLRA